MDSFAIDNGTSTVFDGTLILNSTEFRLGNQYWDLVNTYDMWLFLASKTVKSHTHIARLYEKDPIFNTRVVNMYMLDVHRSV